MEQQKKQIKKIIAGQLSQLTEYIDAVAAASPEIVDDLHQVYDAILDIKHAIEKGLKKDQK